MNKSSQKVNYTFELEVRFVVAIILGVSMYFISASIGSGWVLFLAAAVMACLILSIAIPFTLLSKLRPKLLAPPTALAGEAFQIRPQILSSNKLAAQYCKLLILSLVPSKKSAFRIPGQKVNVRSDTYLVESIDSPPKFTIPCPPLRRGKHKLPTLEITSSYPFGLAWVHAYFEAAEEIIVLPRTLSLEGNFVHRLKSSSFVPGDSHSVSSGLASAASRGVRNYVRGDSRRNIHWNLSARHGHLMVKERENEGVPAFDLVFDAGSLWQSDDQFDIAVTAAASILKHGSNLGVHPELFILDSNYEPGQPMLDKTVELDQQLLRLACLERVPTKISSRNYNELLHRSKAVIVIAPAPAEEANGSPAKSQKNKKEASIRDKDSSSSQQAPQVGINRVDPRSRSGVFLISVATDSDPFEPAPSIEDSSALIAIGAILRDEEEICHL